jgi:hypothetical protein
MRWLFLFALACADPAHHPEASEPLPPVQVTARIDKAVATTGDQLRYEVIAKHDPEVELSVSDPGERIAGFRILDLGTEETERADGREEMAWWYTLRADLVGSYVLEGAVVRWRRSPEAPWQEEVASPIFVEVASVLPTEGVEGLDIRDIKALAPPPKADNRVITAALLALLAALLLAAWAVFFRTRTKALTPPRPAHEVALEALAALSTRAEGEDAVRSWHFDLSAILRRYVEQRFALNATDLTTEEILAGADHIEQLSGSELEALSGFLQATDRVKFAGHTAGPDDMASCHAAATDFVHTTKAPPPSEGASP